MSDKRKLWYTRIDNKVRGPFPSATIQASLLLGRLSETNEISENQIIWHRIKEFPELIPEELKADLSLAKNREKLRLARMRVDERRQERRSGETDEDDGGNNRQGERRADESPEALALRRARVERKLRELERKPESYTVRFSIFICFIASVLWLAYTAGSHSIVANSGCNIQTKPTIVWDNCRMDGIQLPGENLAGARMVNTSLIGADLRNAQLVDADLSYANLTSAVLDGANFAASNLKGANFRQARLASANLQNANLEFAILRGADLRGVSFNNANLTHVDFGSANLENADFSGAILDKAIWSDNTVCAPQSLGRCLPVE